MSFVEAVKTCFRKYATFSGRATRAEYWWFALLNFLVAAVLGGISLPFSTRSAVDTGIGFAVHGAAAFPSILAMLWSLGVLVPSLAVAWRRFHDTDKSGLYYLLALIPFVGWILVLVFLAMEGTRGPNRYGPDPRQVDAWNEPYPQIPTY